MLGKAVMPAFDAAHWQKLQRKALLPPEGHPAISTTVHPRSWRKLDVVLELSMCSWPSVSLCLLVVMQGLNQHVAAAKELWSEVEGQTHGLAPDLFGMCDMSIQILLSSQQM